MSDLETRMRSAFADHRDSIPVNDRLLTVAIRRGNRRVRTRRAAAGVVAVLVLVGSAVGLVSLRGDENSFVVATSGAGRWLPVETSNWSNFSGEGDVVVTAVTPWRNQLVVLGVLQPPSGDNTVLAWTSSDGTDWERNELDWPAGCDPHGGLVARGDQLLVTCRTYVTVGGEDVSNIAVAVTTDLARWTVHNVVSGGQWFGSLIGPGPGDTVVVQALEAADPDTTLGARTRVWSSDDLTAWTEIGGETADSFLDGHATAIRYFGDVTILTGIVNEWPTEAGPNTPAVMRPAIWASTAGSPFRRTILSTGGPAPGLDGAVMDVAASNGAYVAVGSAGAGSTGLAWYSTDLTDWTMVTVASRGANPDVSSPNGLWAVISRPDGTLLAAGGGPDVDTPTIVAWQSTDEGRSWRSAGRGPSLVGNWGDRSVGLSTFPDAGLFWIWEPDSSSSDEEALAHNAGPLANFDPGVVTRVDVNDQPRFFVRRNRDDTVDVWSRRDPKNNCRLVTAQDLAEIDGDAPTGSGTFHDPCHGSAYDDDGERIAGPSTRGMTRYDASVVDGDVIIDLTSARPGPVASTFEDGGAVTDGARPPDEEDDELGTD